MSWPKGKPRSKETKQKQSAALKGKKVAQNVPAHMRDKVACVAKRRVRYKRRLVSSALIDAMDRHVAGRL